MPEDPQRGDNNEDFPEIGVTTEDVEVRINKAFGIWDDWLPTYGATGSMTWTDITTHARYIVRTNMCFFQIRAIGTTAGSANNGLTFTLPFETARRDPADVGGGCMALNTGTQNAGSWRTLTDRITVQVDRATNQNYSLGANTGFLIQGFYELEGQNVVR